MDILPCLTPKTMQYLEINLTKEVKGFYNENPKISLRDLREGYREVLENGVILCSWISKVNTVKITILPKAIYRFNSIAIKIPTILLRYRK